MQKPLKTLLKSLKANKIHFILTIILVFGVFVPQLTLAAILNDISINKTQVLLSVNNLEKLKLKGNNSNEITLILPDVSLNNIYNFNTTNLSRELQVYIPGIKSIELFQYSVDPPETRIIIKANHLLVANVNSEGNNIVAIDLGGSFNNTNNNSAILKTTYNDTKQTETSILPLGKSNLKPIIDMITNGDYQKAKQELEEKILSNDPQNPWASYYLSLIYLNNKEYDLSLELNNKILKQSPNFFASYYILGIINDIKEKPDLAIEMYQKAVDIYPEDINSHYRLGLAYLKTKNIAKAEKEFNYTLKIYPEHSGALQNIGLIQLKKSNFEGAKAYLKSSIRTDSLNNLGNICISQDNPSEALKYFSLALILEPDNAILNYNTAKAYQLLDNNDQALKYYQKALEIEPQMSNAKYNIAIIYSKQGKNDKAIENFQAYLEITPNANDYQQVKSLITQLRN